MIRSECVCARCNRGSLRQSLVRQRKRLSQKLRSTMATAAGNVQQALADQEKCTRPQMATPESSAARRGVRIRSRQHEVGGAARALVAIMILLTREAQGCDLGAFRSLPVS